MFMTHRSIRNFLSYRPIGVYHISTFEAPIWRLKRAYIRTRGKIAKVFLTFLTKSSIACCRTVSSTWRDIKVIGNYAYIVSEARNHGLQVFDLTRLRGKTSAETFLPDATYKGFGNAHNIVSNEETNFVYVVGATQAGFPLSCRGNESCVHIND
jgi:hypothetical protein